MKESDIKKISQAFAISEKDIRQTLKRAAARTENKNQTEKTTTEVLNFYFLAEDFTKFNAKLENIHNEIVRLGKAIGRSCDVSGETFHDNFDYEECGRQQAMWSEEIKKLNAIKRRIKIINPQDNNSSLVSVGRIITINNNGKIMEIKVGSYMTFSPESISYDSGLVKLIFGAKVGDIREGPIEGLKTRIEILSIK